MAIEDLDLEFEDDQQIEKSDAIDVGVDLDFSATAKKPEAAKAPEGVIRPIAQNQATQKQEAQNSPPARVQNINEAQVKARPVQQAQPQARPTSQIKPSAPQPDSDDYAYELDMLRSEVNELRTQMSDIKNSADVKIAVAEAKSEFLVQYISDAKLLDHQVNQMLSRIHKKVPQLKNDVLSIKKYMSDFLAKTKK